MNQSSGTEKWVCLENSHHETDNDFKRQKQILQFALILQSD